jgi:NADH:ubiquinone oxidoreductase subunit 4 (subunit M)
MEMYTPDPKNQWEWAIILGLITAAARIGSGYGFVMFVLGIFALASVYLGGLTLRAGVRLWVNYQDHSGAPTQPAKVVRYSGIAFVAIIVLAVLVAQDPNQWGTAFLLFASGLFLFVVASEVVHELEKRNQEPPQLPDHLKLEDIVEWQETVEGARVIRGDADDDEE